MCTHEQHAQASHARDPLPHSYCQCTTAPCRQRYFWNRKLPRPLTPPHLMRHRRSRHGLRTYCGHPKANPHSCQTFLRPHPDHCKRAKLKRDHPAPPSCTCQHRPRAVSGYSRMYLLLSIPRSFLAPDCLLGSQNSGHHQQYKPGRRTPARYRFPSRQTPQIAHIVTRLVPTIMPIAVAKLERPARIANPA